MAPASTSSRTPRGLHTGVLDPSSPSPLSLVSPPPNSRQSCNESSGFGLSVPSNTLAWLDQLSAPGNSPPVPFRATRTPFGVRCRHFDSAARTACCRSRRIGNFPDTSVFTRWLLQPLCLVRSTIAALDPWSSGQYSAGGTAAHALSCLAASRSHAVIRRLHRRGHDG
jgi:hypothetical protein